MLKVRYLLAWIALLFSGFACFSGRRSSCKSRAIEKDGQRDSRGRCQAVDSAVQCRVVMCSSDGMVYCVQWELKLVSACGRVWRSSNVWPDRAEAEWMETRALAIQLASTHTAYTTDRAQQASKHTRTRLHTRASLVGAARIPSTDTLACTTDRQQQQQQQETGEQESSRVGGSTGSK